MPSGKIETLRTPVGKNGLNNQNDVLKIQKLLKLRKFYTGPLDGICGPLTVKAITKFQATFLSKPDGIITPNGRTWNKLTHFTSSDASIYLKDNKIKAGSGKFPLDKKVNSYLQYPGRFGDPRDKGKRKHAGCDLYAPVGTKIYAVKDGTLIAKPYRFYKNSDAIEINHGDFIARYAEINAVSGLKENQLVTKGQLLGYISDLGLNVSMLHFEMYSGTSTGPLTNKSNPPYKRRNDLIDPTNFLNNCICND
jgi:murein DD-endopeptidase MepM/ murein hydrolase activator NlpD